MGQFRHDANFVLDVVPSAAQDLRDVDDEVELFAAVLNGLFGFGFFDRGGVTAVREPDRR